MVTRSAATLSSPMHVLRERRFAFCSLLKSARYRSVLISRTYQLLRAPSSGDNDDKRNFPTGLVAVLDLRQRDSPPDAYEQVVELSSRSTVRRLAKPGQLTRRRAYLPAMRLA